MFLCLDDERISATGIGSVGEFFYSKDSARHISGDEYEHDAEYDDTYSRRDFFERVFRHFFHSKTIHLPHEKQATRLCENIFFYHGSMTHR